MSGSSGRTRNLYPYRHYAFTGPLSCFVFPPLSFVYPAVSPRAGGMSDDMYNTQDKTTNTTTTTTTTTTRRTRVRCQLFNTDTIKRDRALCRSCLPKYLPLLDSRCAGHPAGTRGITPSRPRVSVHELEAAVAVSLGRSACGWRRGR